MHADFTNLNNVANELTEVVNCFGCVIRFSDTKMAKATIKGFSDSSLEYYAQLTVDGDPYIENKTGKFKSEFLDLFYSFSNFTIANESIKVESIKVDFADNGVNLISFHYFDDNYHLHCSSEWKGNKLKKLYKKLKLLFNLHQKTFNKFDITSIIIVPIKEKEYGFVTLANTSNRLFLTKDIEMIIPVVKRFGIELKYDSALDRLNVKKQEDFQNGLRIIFHQLMSPIVSLRNHIINIKDNKLTEEKHKLRINELMDTYTNFLDMIETHQFFFDYISRGYIIPKIKHERLFDFVNEKVRTYQLRAKTQKGIDIQIIEHNPSRISVFRSDTKLLSHVIQSLLDNAIKYSYNHLRPQDIFLNINYPPPDTPNKIYVTIRNEIDYFEIKIENWGCPIDPIEKDKIKKFEARGKLADKFDATGSGIGLYVVDIIVMALNGQMTITPKGNHTTFYLKLINVN